MTDNIIGILTNINIIINRMKILNDLKGDHSPDLSSAPSSKGRPSAPSSKGRPSPPPPPPSPGFGKFKTQPGRRKINVPETSGRTAPKKTDADLFRQLAKKMPAENWTLQDTQKLGTWLHKCSQEPNGCNCSDRKINELTSSTDNDDKEYLEGCQLLKKKCDNEEIKKKEGDKGCKHRKEQEYDDYWAGGSRMYQSNRQKYIKYRIKS